MQRELERGREREWEIRILGSAAAEFGQQVGYAEEHPDDEQVWAQGQKGQRVQQTGVQPEVTYGQ